jgi:hypothetical protein
MGDFSPSRLHHALPKWVSDLGIDRDLRQQSADNRAEWCVSDRAHRLDDCGKKFVTGVADIGDGYVRTREPLKQLF